MLAPLVVLWLGSAQASPEQRAQLASWAEERGLRAELAPSASESPYDAGVVEQIEAALEAARAAGEAAPDELARAEQLLLAHPELPQAAWLLAERHALGAQARAASDEPASSAELDRARALEGDRAPAAGAEPPPERAPTTLAGIPLAALAAPSPRTRDAVFVDGRPAPERELTPGRHHVRMTRGGQLVWAGWVVAGAGAAARPPDPTRACSALDLADVTLDAARPLPAPGIACALWAAARLSELGGLDVSSCRGSSCSPWQHLGPGAAVPSRPSAAVDEPRAWPGWLTWALIGAGAAATTSLVLWQAGAFERATPSTEFVFTGPSAAAYRF
jgi:hypothetical protein